MRISVSSFRTTHEDVERSAAAILQAAGITGAVAEVSDALRLTADYAAQFLASLESARRRPDGDVRRAARRPRRAASRARRRRRRVIVAELVKSGEPGDRRHVRAAGSSGSSSAARQPAAIAADWLTSTWDQNAGLVCRRRRARRGRRGDRRRVAARAARPARRRLLRVRHRLPDGTRHLPRRGALARPGRRGLGRRTREGLAGAPPRARARRRRGARDGAARASAARDRRRRDRADPGRRAGAHARRRGARRPRVGIGADDRCACRSGTSIPARSTRWRRSWIRPSTPAPGCTSTALSGSGRPRRRPSVGLVEGVDRAHSWATDGHKWLNVPYDCGYAFVADREAHRAAMAVAAAYLIQAEGDDAPREPMDWNPEFSRRARGLPTWAALRALGRTGVGGPRRTLLRARPGVRRAPRRRTRTSRS